MTPHDEEIFDRLYLAWLQCGCDTYPMNEEFERRQRMLIKHQPEPCRHGKTKMTCAECSQ